MATTRARGFAFVLYPESAPENWRQYLDDLHIKWIESPLHEFDVNETGEVKKPHWHIVLSFDDVKSQVQVKKLIEPLNGTIPIILNSVKGMVRYMAHLDNPEKYQYPVDQIIGHGGADVSDLLRVSASARYSILRKICAWIADNDITEFFQLVDYAAEHQPEDWYPIIVDQNSYFLNNYIKSNRQRMALVRKEYGDV